MIIKKEELLFKADEHGNISKVCLEHGCSRDTYYRLNRYSRTGGSIPLKNRKPGRREIKFNEKEKVIVQLSLMNPKMGSKRMSYILKHKGIDITPEGVRYIWQQYDLGNRKKRFMALTAKIMQGDFEIRDIDETIMDELLKRNKQYGYMIPRYPGDVCGHDILTIGRIPKIGKLYQQTFMDFYTNRAEAELYDYEVVSRTARYFLTKLYDSFFPDDWLFIYPRIITPNKSQFFRSKVQPLSYQKFLKENQISHRRRKNIPVVESFHKLIFDDFYIPLLRETSIHTLEELQSKLNHWLIEYNRSKHIKKAYCFGKTPDQTIEDFKVADNQKLPYMQLFYWP